MTVDMVVLQYCGTCKRGSYSVHNVVVDLADQCTCNERIRIAFILILDKA